jgi:large conductance mechanosensitive channel
MADAPGKGLGQEFQEFIARGNVIDLAVGVIIGAAFGKVVTSLVEDIIMPPIGALLGHIDFSSLFFSLNRVSYPSLKAAKDAGAPVIGYGSFINQIVQFVIVALAVFVLVKITNGIRRRFERKAESVAEVKEDLQAKQVAQNDRIIELLTIIADRKL